MPRDVSRMVACISILFLIVSIVPAALPGISAAFTSDELQSTLDKDITSHILINNDTDLQEQASANSWPGDGTAGSPYIIDGLALQVTEALPALQIQNTNLHLTVQNIDMEDKRNGSYVSFITIVNATNVSLDTIDAQNIDEDDDELPSLTISGSSNITVRNCTFDSSEMETSTNITFKENTMTYNEGLVIDDCVSVLFQSNNFSSLRELDIYDSNEVLLKGNLADTIVHGLVIGRSTNVTLWSNSFMNCSLFIICPTNRIADIIVMEKTISSLDAPNNNTVNGRSLLFLKGIDLHGSAVPAGAGQIMLYNVTNGSVQGQNLTKTTNPIGILQCSDLTITENNLGWSYCGMTIINCTGISIIGNDLIHNYVGILTKGGSSILIEDNRLDGSYYFDSSTSSGKSEIGILLRTINSTIRNNTVCTYAGGISIAEGDGSIIEDNHVQECSSGVHSSQGNNCKVINNHLINNDAGIYLYESKFFDINNNSIMNSSLIGVYLYLTVNCSFAGNNISESSNRGIYLYGSSSLVFRNNSVINNGQYALYLRSTNDCLFVDNSFINSSSYGINIASGSDDNLLYGNVISYTNGAGNYYVSTHAQAYDAGLRNKWNNATGGNTWSDRLGPDSDSNGIVDSSYPIGGTAKSYDYLPLASTSYIVDDISPYLTITSPTNGSWTNSNEVFITWTSGDNGSGLYKCYVKEIDVDVWWDVGMDQCAWLYVPEGVHTCYVKAVDLVGNYVIRNVTIGADTTAPSLIVESVGEFINTPSLQLNWTAIDTGIGLMKVELSVNDGEWINVTGNNTYLLANLGDSEYCVCVKATDRFGWNTTVYVNFTADHAFEDLRILDPSDGPVYYNDVEVRWYADDMNGVSLVEMMIDGQDWFDTNAYDYSSYTIYDMSDGDHSISIRAWDWAGNSAICTVNITIDTTGPALRVMSPLQGYFYTVNDVSVDWSASGNSISSMWRLDAGQWQTASGNFILNDLSEGQHWLYFTCVDVDGNYANITRQFAIDTLYPELTITSPVSGHYYNSQNVTMAWSVIDSSNVTIMWNIDEGPWNSGPMNGAAYLLLADGQHEVHFYCYDSARHWDCEFVTFYVDTVCPTINITSPTPNAYNTSTIFLTWQGEDNIGISHFSVSVDGTWTHYSNTTFSATISGLTDGVHTIIVVSNDEATNNDTASVTFIVDMTTPGIDITSPSAGSFGGNNVTVTWLVEEDVSGIASVWIRFDNDAFIEVTGIASYTISSLSEGAHTITIKVVDNLGNTGSSSITYHVDLTSPTISITSPTEGVNLGPMTTISWEANDDNSIAGFSVMVDQRTLGEVSSGSSSITVRNLGSGEHTIYVRVIDVAGNMAQDSVSFFVDGDAPSLKILSPSRGSYYNTSSVKVSWTGSDIGVGMDYYVIYIDGGNQTITTSTSISFMLADGVHTIYLRAYDRVGNYNDADVSVIVDTVAPTIMISSPSDGSYNNTGSMKATWFSTDITSMIAYHEVNLDGTWTILSNGTQEQMFDDLSEGVHTVMIRAFDHAGNYYQVSATFIVDLTDPTVNIHSPFNGSLDNTGVVTIGWEGADTQGVAYYVLNLDGRGLVRIEPGANNYSLNDLADGYHTVLIAAVDLAWNTASSTTNFTVDKTSPKAECDIGGNVRSSSWNLTITLSETVEMDGLTLTINGAIADITVIDTLTVAALMDAPLSGDSILVNITCADAAGNIAAFTWTFNIDPLEHSVNGTVLSDDGEPISGASVYCNGTLMATTDANGNFSFFIVPGSYEVRIVKSGYVNTTQTLQLTDEDQGMSGLVLSPAALADDDDGSNMSMVLIAIGAITVVAVGAMLFVRARKR